MFLLRLIIFLLWLIMLLLWLIIFLLWLIMFLIRLIYIVILALFANIILNLYLYIAFQQLDFSSFLDILFDLDFILDNISDSLFTIDNKFRLNWLANSSRTTHIDFFEIIIITFIISAGNLGIFIIGFFEETFRFFVFMIIWGNSFDFDGFLRW